MALVSYSKMTAPHRVTESRREEVEWSRLFFSPHFALYNSYLIPNVQLVLRTQAAMRPSKSSEARWLDWERRAAARSCPLARRAANGGTDQFNLNLVGFCLGDQAHLIHHIRGDGLDPVGDSSLYE